MECRWIDGPRASRPVPRVSGLKKNNNKKKNCLRRFYARLRGPTADLRKRCESAVIDLAALQGLSMDSRQVERSPTPARQSHGAPIVSADYCCDHRNQGPRDSRQKKKGGKKNRKSQPRSRRAEEIIIITITAAAAAAITVIITAITRAKLTTQKPAAPPACLHSHACPFIDCAPRFQIRLRARREKFRENRPGNEIIRVIYANQLCCQLIKNPSGPPLESEEVHLFS